MTLLGPLFVTRTVYVVVPPAMTAATPSVFEICKFAEGRGGIGVFVAVGLAVPVKNGGTEVAFVLVGLAIINVLVADGINVGVTGVLVFGGMLLAVKVGNGVRVGNDNDAPGVRNTSIQTGLVRIAGSRGSIKLTGRLVRKSLPGLRFDPILVFSFQLGAKRSAHPLAKMMQKNPNNRIKTMMRAESRLSFSRGLFFIETSIHRETHIYGRSRVGLFVMPGAFQPDASTMRVHNAARDGEPKPGTTTFEFCFS